MQGWVSSGTGSVPHETNLHFLLGWKGLPYKDCPSGCRYRASSGPRDQMTSVLEFKGSAGDGIPLRRYVARCGLFCFVLRQIELLEADEMVDGAISDANGWLVASAKLTTTNPIAKMSDVF